MVRGLLNKIVSRSLSVAGKWQQQQLRRLNVHEYQGAELMKNMGSMCLRVLIFLLLMKQKTQFKLVFLMRKSWSLRVKFWLVEEVWEHSKAA
ncbi:uncharacterized protein LOC111488496 isoform X1 [Cucurbita maxima]|uniref:Uncharacterized protein LOC111488496 isoform X1 n=1 Tax=Cucurbita maxima TaxID=3661 RepID=A0A6J1JWF6_CUCMA|nr:uncharacterized protein LOC111488496 isoform X1 [Cucurbita maxima]